MTRVRVALRRAAVGGALLLRGAAAHASVDVEVDEPRAFGYTVGDVVQRHVVLHVPAGLLLDADSVPAVGRKGRALELREWHARVSAEPGGQRHEIRLAYQVFVAPTAVRTLEMPPVVLRFRGTPRDRDVRIDAWPLVVSPLVPVDVSPRRGLGELQPDAPPPLIDTAPGRRRLIGYAALLALLLGALFAAHVAAPWLDRQRRPFERAWATLRGAAPLESAERRHAALRQLHAALNQTAGQVVFASGIDRFVAARPQFAPLRDDLAAFFGRSQRAFFAVDGAADRAGGSAAATGRSDTAGASVPVAATGRGDAAGANPGRPLDDTAGADGAWLLGFARRCRDIERGIA